MYRVTWTEVSEHERVLTAEELASLLGIEPDQVDAWVDEELDEETYTLEDSLAELDDDGFKGLTREGVDVSRVHDES